MIAGSAGIVAVAVALVVTPAPWAGREGRSQESATGSNLSVARPAIKLPPIPGLKKRIFGIDFSGTEHLVWGLDQTVTGPNCTENNSGHGSETITWHTKTEARVQFYAARNHGGIQQLTPGLVQTASVRSSTLTTTGCTAASAPTGDCNKGVAGTAAIRVSYETRRDAILLNLGPINNPFSGGKMFNCPFLFNVFAGPQDLVAVNPPTQGPLFGVRDTTVAMLQLKRGENAGQNLARTWRLAPNVLYCTEQAPGLTCTSNADSVYQVSVERIK